MTLPVELRPTKLPADEYRVSVVLPVYSETDSLRNIANWLDEHVGERLLEVIIVLSPKSSPESKAVCNELARANPKIRFEVQRVNPGLGNAVRQGLAATRGNVVLMMDSDGEMEIETVPRMIERMARENNDMVIASRWLPGGGFQGYSPFKRVLNWGFQQLFRVLFRTRLHDLTYGFKLVRGDWRGRSRGRARFTRSPARPLSNRFVWGVRLEVHSRWTARTQGATKNSFFRNFRYVRTALHILFGGVATQPASPVTSGGIGGIIKNS